MDSPVFRRIMDKCGAMSIAPTRRCLAVSIRTQRMLVFDDGGRVRQYPVSTSKRPPSNVADSRGTPRGLHRVAERIGSGEPAGMVFRGRRPVGKRFAEMPAEDRERNLVTSRILWLEGLEPGINAGPGRDSRERSIYIHGTNHEDRIGRPFSGGCIEMMNTDVIELFDATPLHSLVWIE